APHDRVEAAGVGHLVRQVQRPAEPRVVRRESAAQVDAPEAVAAWAGVEQAQPDARHPAAGGGSLSGRPFAPTRRGKARGAATLQLTPGGMAAKNSWWWRTLATHGAS